MKVSRGEVVLIDWPFAGGTGSKRRPAVVVQSDQENVRLTNTIVAMITTRTQKHPEPTQLLIDVATPEGQQTGIHRTSIINCVNLFTVEQGKIVQKIGTLSAGLLQKLDSCLKSALDLT